MRTVVTFLIAVFLLPVPAAIAQEPVLDTDHKKALYALGVTVSRRLGDFDLKRDEVALVQAGLADGILGRDSRVDMDAIRPTIEKLLAERAQAVAQAEKEAGREFVAAQAGEPGAVQTDSGMVYFEVVAGSGAEPTADDRVRVHYHGTLVDGTVFDSSRKRGSPATFSMSGVIGCFSEGIGRMKVGGQSKLVCPPEIAYGDRGSPPSIKPGATLVFEVELLEIVNGSTPTP